MNTSLLRPFRAIRARSGADRPRAPRRPAGLGTRHPRRSGAALLAAGLLAAGLAACSNSSSGTGSSATPTGDAAASGDAAFPVTVTGQLGTATVPAQPTRVVALDWTDADIALGLGVTPVAIQNVTTTPGGIQPWTAQLLGGAKPTLLTTDSGDPIDQIAALNPDLILATKDYNLTQSYQQLSKIAPVVSYVNGPNSDSWQTDTLDVAKALGKTGQANQLIAKVTSDIAAAKSAHPELAGKTYNFVISPTASGAYVVNSTTDVSAQFLDQLGLQLAPGIVKTPASDIPGRTMLSWENVGLLDADILLVTGPPSSAQVLASVPGYSSLPVVKRGAAVEVALEPAQAIGFPSPASLEWALNQVVPQLVAAAQK